jgi:histidine triad (HIT) family protein
MSDCIFCKIAAGEIPADKLYEDDHVVAFRDLGPQAPTHALLIPKAHIANINALDEDNADIMGKLFLAAKKVAEDEGIAENGFRTVLNCNQQGGQTVYHMHVHLLGGRQMTWPPG